MESCREVLTFESVDEIMVLYILYVVLTLGLWMKSYGGTIQMKPRQQYFHMVPFVFQYITKRKLGSFPQFLLWPLLGLKGILSDHPS